VSQDLSRRRFLVSAAAATAGLALADMPWAMAAPSPSRDAVAQAPASGLPTLSEALSGDPGSMKFVNYATYVQDQGRVDAARAEHVAYADALREHDRLVMGGPVLGDDGRARGVLLVYQVASKQEAETLVQSDPFVLQHAIADYRLAEWAVLSRNVDVQSLATKLVTADRHAPSKKPGASGAAPAEPDARLYINVARYVSDHSRIERVRPAHRSYAQSMRAKGALIIAGPFADDSGALLVYQARSKEEAKALVLEDPYTTEGVYETYALSEWRLFGLNAGLIG
jgi:uncharacterized protein YciI